jgi:hypothetical protein
VTPATVRGSLQPDPDVTRNREYLPMSISDAGIRAATTVVVAISAMWAATFAAEALSVRSPTTLWIGAFTAYAAADAFARLSERHRVRKPPRLLGPER